MDERILVRVDEESPSDEKTAIRLVEVKHLNPEFSAKLDILEKKIDALSEIDGGVEALTEIKNVLIDFNSSLRALEAKPVPRVDTAIIQNELLRVNDSLEGINNKLNADQVLYEVAKSNVQLESIREKMNNDTLPTELNKVSELLAVMTNSINDVDTKLVTNKIEYSDVRYEIDKLSSALGDIYSSVESLKGVNARDNAEIDEIKNLIHDTTLHLDAMNRKSEALSESMIISSADHSAMEGRLYSELENLQNMITGLNAASQSVDNTELLQKLDSIKKSVSLATGRVAKNQVKIDKSIKDFNAYLVRLNSIDYTLRLLQAKNLLKTKKRMPKWAKEKKKSIEALIAAIEDEVSDIMIVNAIPKDGLDVTVLSKSIGRTRKKTIERLAQLLAAGYLDERKVKRKKVYFLVS